MLKTSRGHYRIHNGNLNKKKYKWKEDAMNLPSVLDYLKENIYK